MEVPEELRVALELAQRTMAAGGKTGLFAREMVHLLAVATKRIEGVPTPVVQVGALRKGNLEYVVEGSGAAEVLAEHRLSGRSNPFRCPKALYEAMAKVLGAAQRPLAVEEIASEVERLMGERPADYEVRVSLRCWMHVEPPLVIRRRARYRPVHPAQAVSEFADLWDRLRATREK